MKTTIINGIEINLANFPGNNGAGGICRNTGCAFNYITITPNGTVTFKEDAEAGSEVLGKLGVEFKSEADLINFINAEFPACK
ncbi:MAG: hypothetical protein KGJ13_11185 [Patescibacteria group bacterium]|nr:hypothetical protein [Patescibacteria group bacterium]